MFLIVGLGNPGKQYEHTRHNIGFDVMDALAEKYNISISEKKHKALCGKGVIEGEKVLLVKPQTYMNLSGESIAEILNYYKLDAEEDFLVVFDDISLAPGNIRIRKKGSAGGHNGIKNIIAMTGTQNFLRIKVGVGVGRSAAVDGQRQPKVGQRTQKHDHAHGEQQPGGPLLGGILRVNVFRHGKNLLFTISYIV